MSARRTVCWFLIAGMVTVPLLVCGAGWALAATPHQGARALSAVVANGQRIDVWLTSCNNREPARLVVYHFNTRRTGTTRQSRFIHDRLRVLARMPVAPPCG